MGKLTDSENYFKETDNETESENYFKETYSETESENYFKETYSETENVGESWGQGLLHSLKPGSLALLNPELSDLAQAKERSTLAHCTTKNVAEFWAIYRGLMLAWDLCYKNLIQDYLDKDLFQIADQPMGIETSSFAGAVEINMISANLRKLSDPQKELEAAEHIPSYKSQAHKAWQVILQGHYQQQDYV
ncbi:hypothetical protein FXO38_03709 [Capsicum annuum]|nr:hypothetical protein FXO38_03709 [Capsicum annuum]KAF3679958.1 hypothetical protein FXO37_03578 [Capsicum annuum]